MPSHTPSLKTGRTSVKPSHSREWTILRLQKADFVSFFIFVFGFVLRYTTFPNPVLFLSPPFPSPYPLTGQLVAWHPPDALLRTVGMLCFWSVSLPTWQHVGSAIPELVEALELLALGPHGLVVNPQMVIGSKTVWVGLALPTRASQWMQPCAPWVLSSMSLMCYVS